MTSPSTILVTHCHTRIGYAVSRSLTKAGYRVIAASRCRPSMCRGLSGVVAETVYPEPFNAPLEFIESLSRAANRYAARAVLPVHEEIFVLARHRQEFATRRASTQVLAPPITQLLRLHDKGHLPQLAHAASIVTPATRIVSTRADLLNAVSDIGLPAVLKPRFGSGARGLRLLRNTADLKAVVLGDEGPPTTLLQEWVPGTGVGIGGLFLQGEAFALSGHLRLREIPLSGGASTARVTLTHRDMQDAAKRLIASVGFSGVAMAEFRYDRDTDRAWLLEVNPRYWGGVSTAIDSGVDIPSLHVSALLDGSLPTACVEPSRIVESRWLLGELRAAIERLIHGQLTAALRMYPRRSTVPVVWEDIGRGRMMAFLSQAIAYADSFLRYGNLGGHSAAKDAFLLEVWRDTSGYNA